MTIQIYDPTWPVEFMANVVLAFAGIGMSYIWFFIISAEIQRGILREEKKKHELRASVDSLLSRAGRQRGSRTSTRMRRSQSAEALSDES